MEKSLSFLRKLGTLIGLAALQVLILDRIALFGYVTPLFYIWMIVRFDTSMSRNETLFWSFFLGLTIDMFSGTPGLNAACATLLAMFQLHILNLFVLLDRTEHLRPCAASMGGGRFMGYLSVMILLHHTVYFILRSIPLGDWHVLLVKIVLSGMLTFVMMLVAEYSGAKSNKR